MSELKELAAEAKHELLTHIIPFWRGMRDDKFGGYYWDITVIFPMILHWMKKQKKDVS